MLQFIFFAVKLCAKILLSMIIAAHRGGLLQGTLLHMMAWSQLHLAPWLCSSKSASQNIVVSFKPTKCSHWWDCYCTVIYKHESTASAGHSIFITYTDYPCSRLAHVFACYWLGTTWVDKCNAWPFINLNYNYCHVIWATAFISFCLHLLSLLQLS